MIDYLIRRLVGMIPVVLGVATLTFILIHLVPGDPVVAMIGDTAQPAEIVAMRHQLGLDRPLVSQYRAFVEGWRTAISVNRSRCVRRCGD